MIWIRYVVFSILAIILLVSIHFFGMKKAFSKRKTKSGHPPFPYLNVSTGTCIMVFALRTPRGNSSILKRILNLPKKKKRKRVVLESANPKRTGNRNTF